MTVFVVATASVVGGAQVNPLDGRIIALLLGGVVLGLGLLVRGFAGYRAADRIAGIAPSRIASLAAGEVLVSGAAEPIELTLVSPLQSSPCLYYRSRVTDRSERGGVVFREERAVGFRIRDQTGTIRIFPAGARFDVPDRYDEQTGLLDSTPAGLLPRTGTAFGPGPDRASQVAELLTVHGAGGSSLARLGGTQGGGFGPGEGVLGGSAGIELASRERRYTEARIEPGEVVTVVGRALPFGDLADPTESNLLDAGLPAADDPEIAADLAAARDRGELAATPAAAWGNAAIEGFGIGRPVRRPELDPAAQPLPAGDAALAARARDAFDIAPESLVLATTAGTPLVVSLGAAGSVVARQRDRFLVGLLGAVLAIGCAITLAVLLGGAG